MTRILLLLLSILVLTYASSLKDMDKDEASASFECIAHIVCDLWEGEVLKNVYDAAEEEARNNGVTWLAEAYKMSKDQYEDHDRFWRDYSDVVCVYPKEQRREAFKTFMIKFVDYYEQICEPGAWQDTTECEGANKGMAAGMEIVKDYTAKGECNDPKEAAKGMADTGKSKLGGMSG